MATNRSKCKGKTIKLINSTNKYSCDLELGKDFLNDNLKYKM